MVPLVPAEKPDTHAWIFTDALALLRTSPHSLVILRKLHGLNRRLAARLASTTESQFS